MNRTKIFMINVISSLLLQFVTIISGFIIPKIMVNSYGSEINGLVNSLSQFISYFALIEVGLAGAAVASLFKPLAEKNDKEINSILVASRNFYYKVGIIFIGLVCALSIFYPIFINSSNLSFLDVCLLSLTLGASGTIEFFSILKYRVLLTADQKIYILSFSSILYSILNTVLIYILASSGLNVVLVRFFAISSIILRSLILYFYCKKKYTFINYKEKPNYSALKKKWDVLFIQLADAVQKGAPIIIATFLYSLEQVSIFSTYIIVIVGINSILSIFSTSLYTSFGDLLAREKLEEFNSSFSIYETFYFMLEVFIYVVSFFVINGFVSVYMKNADISYQLGWIGFLFVVNGFFYNLKVPYQTTIPASGKFKEIRTPLIIQISIAIIGGFLFGLWLGIVGILIAMILSNIVYDIYLSISIPKIMFNKEVMLTSLKRVVLCFICCLICSFIFVFYRESCYSYLDWIKYSIKVSILTIAVILVIFSIFEFKTIKKGTKKIFRILKRERKTIK